jgi:glycosyltransferase involved in cell wall biosynthesis
MADSETPFVSIIIPTYNGGSKLLGTLASCLKIKDVEIEILLIDDCSSDDTPDQIQRQFPTVKLYRLGVNSGSGSHGRNVGLALAQGRYVKFLDHDDLIQPRGFKAECREALRTDADIIMSRWGVATVDAFGRFRKQDLRLFTPPEPGRLLEAILSGEATPYTAAALYKRSYVCAERWDASLTLIDDFDWFCRMALKRGAITRIQTVSYFWRLHANSTQARSHRQATIYQELISARFSVYTKIERILEDSGQLTEAYKKLLAKRYYTCLRCFARYDRAKYKKLWSRIRCLDPEFAVDASCESEAWARVFIQQVGVASFLRCYGLLRRFGDRASRLPARLRRGSKRLFLKGGDQP